MAAVNVDEPRGGGITTRRPIPIMQLLKLIISLIKFSIGLAWLGASLWLLGVIVRHVYIGLTERSTFTEEGMKWQRENNPEYIKAKALKDIADKINQDR